VVMGGSVRAMGCSSRLSSSKGVMVRELATPCRQSAPPLLRLVGLPRFFEDRDVRAPMRLARRLFAVHHQTRRPSSSTVRHPIATTHSRLESREDPFSGLNPSSEFHPCITANATSSLRRTRRPPLPRLGSPLTSCQSTGATYPRAFHRASYVAPSGFLTLSTLCSPFDLPSLFHLGSAFGVCSSRPFSTPDAIIPLGTCDPREVSSAAAHGRRPPLQGLHTRSSSPARARV